MSDSPRDVSINTDVATIPCRAVRDGDVESSVSPLDGNDALSSPDGLLFTIERFTDGRALRHIARLGKL